MRELDKICEKCNKPLIMYYKIYCPRCEKPEVEVLKYYNLIKCLYYIEVSWIPGFKNQFWEHLCKDYDFTNDSTIEIYNDEHSHSTVKTLFKKMGIKKDCYLFEISW
jgi:predicted amidophosphoribosyltransferase